MTLLAFVCVLALLSGLAVAFWQFGEAERWRRTAQEALIKAAQAEAEAAAEKKVAGEQVKLLEAAQTRLDHHFRSLAAEALQANSQTFLDRSREQVQGVVAPVQEVLRRFDQNVRTLEQSRAEAYGSITAQLRNLMDSERELRQSADQLRNALRAPQGRGRWGEVQLRRVLEMAGMLAHCDFNEQVVLDNGRLRPDVVVHLPNGRNLVVDAKVSMEAYLKAIDAESEAERRQLLGDHARQVRAHVKALGEKSYWERLGGSPEFVVAFLPLESLYSAALQHDGELLSFGVEKRVLLATPTSLIAILFSIAQGWREREFGENSARIRELGKELYERLLSVHGKLGFLGGELQGAVEAYNSAIWQLESRVFVTGRKFCELQGRVPAEMEELAAVDAVPRLPVRRD